MTILFKDRANSTLAAPISNTATTLAVQAGAGALFPQPVNPGDFFMLVLTDAATKNLYEVMSISNVSGDTFTILARGLEGTSPQAWGAGDIAFHSVTAGTLTTFAQQQGATAALPFWVDGTSGTDNTNKGTAPGAGAFRTAQYSYNFIQSQVNARGFVVTLNANGAVGPMACFGGLVGQAGAQGFVLNAAVGATMAAVAGSGPASHALFLNGASLTLQGAITLSSLSGNGIITGFSNLLLGNGLAFGACASAQITSQYGSLVSFAGGTLTFIGNASQLLYLESGRVLVVAGTTFNVSTVTYSNAVVAAVDGSTCEINHGLLTWTGSTPTGRRFISNDTSLIDTGGGTTTFIPGTIAGTAQNTWNYQ